MALMTADAEAHATDGPFLVPEDALTISPARAGSWRVVTVRGPIDRDGEATLVAILTRAVATSR